MKRPTIDMFPPEQMPVHKAVDLTDDNGVRYTPIMGGYKVTFPDGVVKYLYLNPSSDDTDGLSNVFVYFDEGNFDSPECYIAIEEGY